MRTWKKLGGTGKNSRVVIKSSPNGMDAIQVQRRVFYSVFKEDLLLERVGIVATFNRLEGMKILKDPDRQQGHGKRGDANQLQAKGAYTESRHTADSIQNS